MPDTPQDTAGTGVSFRLGADEYRVDDLTLNDIAEIEEANDATPIAELLESGRMKPMLHMAWCIRRHSEPDITLDEVGDVRMSALVEQGEEADLPPTEAAEAPETSADAGRRGTSGRTASGRGKSAS